MDVTGVGGRIMGRSGVKEERGTDMLKGVAEVSDSLTGKRWSRVAIFSHRISRLWTCGREKS